MTFLTVTLNNVALTENCGDRDLAESQPASSKRWRLIKASVIASVLLAFLFTLVGCASNYHVPVIERHQPTLEHKQSHAVQRGETLYSIAWRYGLDYKRLAKLNGIGPPYLIKPGQTLQLRGKSAAKNKHVVSRRTSTTAKTDTKKSPSKSARKAANSSKLAWTWPIHGKVIRYFSADGKHHGKVNKGIDIEGKIGTPIRATLSGKVVYAGSGLTGYGQLIILKHNADYLSAYAHNRKLLVKEGQTVKVGEKIAELGKTEAESPRLHFEIRREGKPVNPLTLLPKQR